MHDNKFIIEDWEKISAQEMSYIQEEKRRKMNEEWEEWEQNHKKPAKISVTLPKKKEVKK